MASLCGCIFNSVLGYVSVQHTKSWACDSTMSWLKQKEMLNITEYCLFSKWCVMFNWNHVIKGKMGWSDATLLHKIVSMWNEHKLCTHCDHRCSICDINNRFLKIRLEGRSFWKQKWVPGPDWAPIGPPLCVCIYPAANWRMKKVI